MTNRKRSRSRDRRLSDIRDTAGFTLVELLVVVLVLGILAAIAIPVYLGVQAKSKDASVLSDTTNLRAAVFVQQQTNGGTIPASLPATTSSFSSTWKGAGATWGANTTGIVYKAGTGTSFCVAAMSSTGSVFAGSDNQEITRSGQSTLATACP